LLTSPCFRKVLKATVVMDARGEPSLLVTGVSLDGTPVRAQGRARRRLLLRPRPGSGEDAIPPEVEAGPWGRTRRRPPSEVEVEAEP
jgi:hypothetical protein